MAVWLSLLQDCHQVSNTTIVCQDGIIYSHKLVVASLSNFVKFLINDVPANDGIALILPDFTKTEIEKLIHEVVLHEKINATLGN